MRILVWMCFALGCIQANAQNIFAGVGAGDIPAHDLDKLIRLYGSQSSSLQEQSSALLTRMERTEATLQRRLRAKDSMATMQYFEQSSQHISIQGEYIVTYRAPSRLDSFNINHVFYTGDYFFLSKYGKLGKDTKKIIAKNNQDAREKYYKYVDIKVSGKLNEILGLYRKL